MNNLPKLLEIINQKIHSHVKEHHLKIAKNAITNWIKSEPYHFPTDADRLQNLISEHNNLPFAGDDCIMNYFMRSIEDFRIALMNDPEHGDYWTEEEVELLVLLFQERFMTPLITFSEYMNSIEFGTDIHQ